MRDRRKGQDAANGLLTNLIAYWPGNEANGNALDAHTNALHLTDVNTVTTAAGLVYAGARQYTVLNDERHTRPGDDALLSAGDVELTLAAWVYLDSKANQRTIASKYDTALGAREYALLYDNVTDRFQLWVGNATGAASTVLRATTFGSPALSTWYLVVGRHDPTTDTISIQINNGAVDSAAHVGGIVDGIQPFLIGARYQAGSVAFFMSGRIGPTMFWKSAAGAGGVLTAAQGTALFNGGLGLAYTDFTL